MSGNSIRIDFKHHCGMKFSIKTNGKTKKRICPKCNKEIDITKLRL